MNKDESGSDYKDTDIRSGKRGFTLPPMPITSGAPMPSVNPPKKKESKKDKNEKTKN